MKLLKYYNKCSFCGSTKLKLRNTSEQDFNFYEKAISKDLEISKKKLKNIKTFDCLNCFCKLNEPWFKQNFVSKIYSSVYGQHNNSWQNLLNFIKKSKLPEHEKLFNLLNTHLNIKNYGEYNSPFMGFFLNFFNKRYYIKKKFFKKFHKEIIKYLSSRQVAGKTKKQIYLSEKIATKSLNYIKKFKSNINKNDINKILFIDNSYSNWGLNDNFKSVNSKTYAQLMFDVKLLNLEKKNKKFNFDLFGIFHSLDHNDKPRELLNFALKSSNLVLVHCHNQLNEVSKQHHFSFTNNFLKYLKKQKIHILDISKFARKNYKPSEIYFICSRMKKNIDFLKIKLDFI